MTSPARTLADLRSRLSPRALEGAVGRAEVLGLDVGPRRGVEPDLTGSELERRFLNLCRRHSIPLPEVNVRVGSFEVDFLWRASGLIVELDGFRYHGTRTAFEADRARDAQLTLLGHRVLRFTHRQVTGDAPAVVATVRALL